MIKCNIETGSCQVFFFNFKWVKTGLKTLKNMEFWGKFTLKIS